MQNPCENPNEVGFARPGALLDLGVLCFPLRLLLATGRALGFGVLEVLLAETETPCRRWLSKPKPQNLRTMTHGCGFLWFHTILWFALQPSEGSQSSVPLSRTGLQFVYPTLHLLADRVNMSGPVVHGVRRATCSNTQKYPLGAPRLHLRALPGANSGSFPEAAEGARLALVGLAGEPTQGGAQTSENT